ncbi:MAG: IS91 family transposase [Acidobacteria bacterium]|nr:IS91 family transposase [Acidobacteriota bacterium]
MARPVLEVTDIVRQHGAALIQACHASLSRVQHRALRAIQQCRTAALGGHLEQCDRCGHQVISYNSCRNRHCPKCQSLAKAAWLAARQAELLPVPHFHVVFTLPERLAPLVLQNARLLYNLLFQASSQTLLRIAADPKHLGARIGFLAILHTWGQNLLHHPHLHCVAPGGGLAPDGRRWVGCRPGFFLPVRVLSRLFRGLFLAGLQQAFDQGKLQFHGQLQPLASAPAFVQWLQDCRQTEWVVYAKPPFGGPAQVLDYLGRYTHKVAISNHRLLRLQDGQVSFSWKGYRHGHRKKVLTLQATEFLRRFLLHILPEGFVRIRHFGLLANRHRAENLALCRQLLSVAEPAPLEAPQDWRERYQQLTGVNLSLCPQCGLGRLVRIQILPTPSYRLGRASPQGDSS